MKINPWPALTLSFVLSLSAFAQDRAFDQFKHYDARTNHGLGASSSEDSGDLAWAESHYLDAYVNLFKAYRDPYWLEKFIAHFDTIKANAYDLEGDGSYGWYTSKYSYPLLFNSFLEVDASDAAEPELVVNGGFESSGADLVPANWTRTAGTNTTVYRTTVSGEYFSGSAGLAVKYNGGGAATLTSDAFQLSPGRRYNLTFMARTNSMSTTAKIEVFQAGVTNPIAETHDFLAETAIIKDAWMQGGFTFTAPDFGTNSYTLKIRLAKTDQAGWAAYFDDISIKPVEAVVNTVKNGTFETADAGDATLPDRWSRLGTSAYTYLSTNSGEFYSGTKGLVVKSDGATWKEISQQLSYVPGAYYSLTVWGKTNKPAAYGRILVYNVTDSTYVADQTFNDGVWTKQSLFFQAPSLPGKVLNIYLRQSTNTESTWIAYFDELKIEPWKEIANNNPSFQLADGGDATLPAGWERSNSTSSNAYLSNTLNEYFSVDNGVVIKSNSSQPPVLRQRIYLIPGTDYTVRYIARNGTPVAEGKIDVYNSTSSAVLGSATTTGVNWAGGSFSFTAPSSMNDVVYLRLSQPAVAADNSKISYFDDVEVVPSVRRSAAGWTRVARTTATAYTSNKAHEAVGGYGWVIGNDGVTDGYVKQQLRGYNPSTAHSLTFYARTSDAGNAAKAVVYDVTAGTQLGATALVTRTDGFASGRIDFTTPASPGNVIEIRLTQQYYNNTSQYAYFDRISVGERTPWLVHDTMVARPVLKFVKAVRDDTAIEAIYGDKADEYLDFIEYDLLPKWDDCYEDLGNGRGVYRHLGGNAGGGSFSGRTLPHNQYLVAAESYLLLGDIQGSGTYTSRAQSLLNFFKDKLAATLNPDGVTYRYRWNYWGSAGTWDNGIMYVSYDEDSSHANLDVSAAVMGYRYGVTFNATDMARFTSTFIDRMWNPTDLVIGPNVDSGSSRTPWILEYNTDLWGWIQLTEVSSDAWDVVNVIMTSTINDSWKQSLPYLHSVMAALACYNPEMLMNGGFEAVSIADSTLPSHWSRYLGYTTSSTAYRDTVNPYHGKAGLASKSNGSAWNITQQAIRHYLPNTPYTLRLRGKVGTTSVRGRADVFNYTTVNAVGSVFCDDITWEPASLSFTTPNNTTDDLRVDLYHNLYSTPNYFAYFDDVRIYAGLWDSFVPNGGFEQSDAYDATLPRYWLRSSTTMAANAVLTVSEKYKGSASLKLTPSGATAQQVYYVLNGYLPATSYTITFYAKTTGTCGAKVRVWNETDGSALNTVSVSGANGVWTQYSMNVTTPSNALKEVRVYLEHDSLSSPTGDAYFDQIGLVLD